MPPFFYGVVQWLNVFRYIRFALARLSKNIGIHQQIYLVRSVVTPLVFAHILAARTIGHDVPVWLIIATGVFYVGYPHVVYHFHKKGARKGYSRDDHYDLVENPAAFTDNFIVGLAVPLTYYYPPTAVVLIMVGFANLITMGGWKLFRKGVLFTIAGFALGYFLVPTYYYFELNQLLLGLAGLLFVVHFGAVVYLNYALGRKLISSKLKLNKAYADLDEEKSRSEKLLLNILPFEVAQELKEKGKTQARNYDRAAVLFTDFKGFTKMASVEDPQKVIDEINIYFKEFDAITEKFGLEKIKTIGDAYMAAGGIPVASDDYLVNTVFAALEMQEFVSKRKEENPESFTMRVGIHSGPVVAGVVGTKKFQYDIWGDVVNTASRMESAGEVGRVNISQQVYEYLSNDYRFSFEERPAQEVKGKGELQMWFVELAATGTSQG